MSADDTDQVTAPTDEQAAEAQETEADAPEVETPVEDAVSIEDNGPTDEIFEGEVIDIESLTDGVALIEPDPTEALREELAETVARLKAVSGAYRNLQGDMKAFQERQRRQQLLKLEIQKGDTVSRLFAPLQNLKRSLDAMTRAEDVRQDWVKGLEMVHGEFMRGFTDLGLEPVPGVGSSFDPSIHEALTVMPVQDPGMHDTVVQVFDNGYRVGNRLIRPAKVIIGQYTAPAAEE